MNKVLKKISQLPSEVYDAALREIIENNLKCDYYEIELSEGSAQGENFLGELIRIKVKSKEKDLSLILKIPPQNQARREQLQMAVFFEREIKFYDEVLPMYKKFQESKGIDVQVEGFYECIPAAPFEGIFLEDLKVENFQISPSKISFTKDHVILVMKALAKKNAIFLSLKDQQPEVVDKYREMNDLFVGIYHDKTKISYAWVSAQIKLALRVFEKLEESDFKKKALEVLNGNFFKQLEKTVDGKSAEPYSVISHGDCWNNNIMFQNDENGNVINTKLLDYQIMRYSSPITDLTYSIFACTSKSLRDKHYHEFLDAFYETFVDFVKRLGSNPQKLFPREAFEDHLRRFSKYALMMTILVIPSSVSDKADIPDLDDLSENFDKSSGEFDSESFNYVSSKTFALYEERLVGIFQDMYDLNYI